MAADQEVLRSFLVSLGFKVDGVSAKKFLGSLGDVNKASISAGKAVIAVAVSAETMVTLFSAQMEKLYYASKRTGASVENIQALEYGAKRIGLSAGVAQGALEAMSGAMRLNPGLAGMLSGFGIKSAGVDKMHVMLQLVQQLSKMPHYVGAKFAQMFGMDEQTFLMMKQGMPEMLRSEKERIRLNREAGISADDAALASKEYMNSLRGIKERVEVLGQSLTVKLLPYFRALNSIATDALDWMLKFRTAKIDFGSFGPQITLISEDLKQLAIDLEKVWVILVKFAKSNFVSTIFSGMSESIKGMLHGLLSLVDGLLKLVTGDVAGASAAMAKGVASMAGALPSPGQMAANVLGSVAGVALPAATSAKDIGHTGPRGNPMGTSSKSALGLFGSLEEKYKLPEGLLDRIWSKESARGKYMESPVGAKGHFGFMGPTAKQYGVADPNDLTQSAEGAAHYMHDLLNKYKGNLQMAAAAYNWGPGNVDRKGLGALPSETRDYVKSIAGGPATMSQVTHINVSGATNPDATAKAIGNEQKRVNADIVRNMAGVVQ